jgi:hypothetical protein
MSTPDAQEQAAVDLVRKLLHRRLERSGVLTDRPEAYVQCEAAPRQGWPGGTQVRVNVWRSWSRARVDFDADTGELLGRSIVRYSDPPSEEDMTQAEAVAAAGRAVKIPPDAELKSCYSVPLGPRRRAIRLEWRHIHRGMPVDGDCLWVLLHPETRRLIEYFRRWRQVDLK